MAGCCVFCGGMLKDFYKFCGVCGKQVPIGETTEQVTVSTGESKLNLSQFKKRREEKRQNHSHSSSTSKAAHAHPPEENYVSVLVGLAERNKFGDLKPVRGKRLPVRLKDNSSHLKLKGDAITKHADNDQDFCFHETWVMVYPDMKEVIFIPGTTKNFVLKEYKKYLGKPYSQIIFYLCTQADFSTRKLVDRNKEDNISQDELFTDQISSDLSIPKEFFSDIMTNFDNIPVYSDDCTLNSNSSNPTCAIPVPVPVNQNGENTCTEQTFGEKLNTIGSILKENGSAFQLTIRRKKAWLDTSQKLKRVFKNGVQPLTIKFIGEEASDVGGPLKEFYGVVFDDVKNYLMISGHGSRFTFLHDLEKLKNGDFFLLGNLFALAILSGCAGPRCLMPGKELDNYVLDVRIRLVSVKSRN